MLLDVYNVNLFKFVQDVPISTSWYQIDVRESVLKHVMLLLTQHVLKAVLFVTLTINVDSVLMDIIYNLEHVRDVLLGVEPV